MPFSRLAQMPRSPRVPLLLALTGAAALLPLGCGGEDAKLLPGETAREILQGTPPEDSYWALLPSFLDGLLDAALPGNVIVDGWEAKDGTHTCNAKTWSLGDGRKVLAGSSSSTGEAAK